MAPIFAKDFLTIKIDTDRMTHGQKLFDATKKERSGGLPWIVIVDTEGKERISGVGEKGNVGCPVQPHEVAHFLKMVDTTRAHMTDEEFESLGKSLKAFAKEILERRNP